MNEEQKDKGLKRAIKEENGFRLPSNFAYRTMRKVEEAIRFLIGCCIAGLIIYFGDTIREAFTRTEMVETEQIQIPSFCLLIFIAIPLFVLFDRWMRKRYYKHHS